MKELIRHIMQDRSRELVPGSWSLVRVRALTTGPTVEGCYFEPLRCLPKNGAAERECKR